MMFAATVYSDLVAEPVIVKTEEANASATWIVATAAPHHVTGNHDLLSSFTTLQHSAELFVHAADGTPMQVLGCGNVVTDAVVLPDVWYIPGLTANLISVSQLAELDYGVGFSRASATSGAPMMVGSSAPLAWAMKACLKSTSSKFSFTCDALLHFFEVLFKVTKAYVSVRHIYME